MDSKKKFWLQPEWIVAILVTAAACALHLYYWRHMGGLWRDEVNLVNLSGRHSLTEMQKDAFPVLMPLLVHVWLAVGLGGGDLRLRLIGLLVGLGILAALWVSAWKVRRAPPLLGLVLLGLNSTVIVFGDSLRAYGLGSLFAILLTASAFVFLSKPSPMRAVWLGLFAVLSVQTLYHDAVLVAAICFGAWAVCWRRSDGRSAVQILVVAVASAASLLPYAHNLLASVGASQIIRTGIELRRFFSSFQDTLGFPRFGYLYVWILLALVSMVRAAAGLRLNSTAANNAGGSRLETDFSLFASITLLVGALGFPIFFWRAQVPMQSWYLLPFMASAVVCFDAARPSLPGLVCCVFLLLVAGTAALSGFATTRILAHRFSDVNVYARELTAGAEPDDYILVYPWTCGITFDHYYHGPAPWNTVPPLSDHSIHRVDLVLAQMENTNAIAPVLAKISQTLQSGHRVWFLTTAGTQIPAPAAPAPPPLPPLPPPPLAGSGWSDNPYSQVWESETLHFIAIHSAGIQRCSGPPPNGCLIENMALYVATGDKDGAMRSGAAIAVPARKPGGTLPPAPIPLAAARTNSN